MIKCVIFDYGDTLVDTKSTTQAVFDECVLEAEKLFDYKFTKTQIAKAIKQTDEKFMKYPNTQRLTEELLYERIFLKILGITFDEKLAKKNSNIYFDVRNKHRKLFPTVIETLEYLKEKNISTNVITNTKNNANLDNAKQLGIYKYFYNFINTFEFGGIKSELKVFTYALEQINKNRKDEILAEECLMVGNHLGEDTAAKKIGMKTAILTKAIYSHGVKEALEPDYYINELIEIKDIIKKEKDK